MADVQTPSSIPEKTRAIVARSFEPTGPPNWNLETVKLGKVEDDEVVVKIVAVGICHTDIITSRLPAGTMWMEYPRIPGHEGSGIVLYVGRSVTRVSPGDPVLLSFTFCDNCNACENRSVTHCPDFNVLNFGAVKAKFFTESGGEPVVGCFFGQSSFANVTIAKANSVVSVKGLVDESKLHDELKLFAPMGCGLIAGSGAVTNVAGATENDRIVIMGLGSVGLAAVMAAKICGCRTIIALDRLENRVVLAKSLGAHHGLTNSEDLKEKVNDMTEGLGVTIVLDATGVIPLIELGVDIMLPGGKMILVGVPPPGEKIKLNATPFLQDAKQLISSIEGGSRASESIPRMISWYRAGKLPIDKIVKHYAVEEFRAAVQDMQEGGTIKPVLCWPV